MHSMVKLTELKIISPKVKRKLNCDIWTFEPLYGNIFITVLRLFSKERSVFNGKGFEGKGVWSRNLQTERWLIYGAIR